MADDQDQNLVCRSGPYCPPLLLEPCQGSLQHVLDGLEGCSNLHPAAMGSSKADAAGGVLALPLSSSSRKRFQGSSFGIMPLKGGYFFGK